jgi:caffeoyl-CoA O-methyltransferase
MMDNPPDRLVLYGCWRSTCTHRATLALTMRAVPFDYVPVDLDRREQDSPAFRAISADGQVPVAVMAGRTIPQSLAIVTLAEALGDPDTPSLFPADALDRAEAVSIAERVGSFIQPFTLPGTVRRSLGEALAAPGESEALAPRLAAFVRDTLSANLAALDARLARRAGPFCLGDAPTVADIFVYPQLLGAARAGLDVNGFPRLSKLYEAMRALPAARATDPETMPDAPSRRAPTAGAPTAGAPAASRPPAPPAAQGRDDATTLALAYKEPPPDLAAYLDTRVNHPIRGLDQVRSETFARFGPVGTKVSAVEVCRFLRWTAAQMGARRALEVGVFTGSSSLALLEGMGPDGGLDAIDISEDYTAVARAAWADAGVADRVRLIIDDGVHALTALRGGKPYDLAYVDALNEHYQAYHRAVMPLMRPGGLIIFDNVLWRGRVTDPATTDPSARHLHDLNLILRDDPRLATTIISLGDGLALCIVL